MKMRFTARLSNPKTGEVSLPIEVEHCPEHGYSIVTSVGVAGVTLIKCHTCLRTSANPNDVKEKYCGNCHKFHGPVTVQ